MKGKSTRDHSLVYLSGQEEVVYGDVGYKGVMRRSEHQHRVGHLAHPPTEGIGLLGAGAAGMGKTSASAKSQRENPC